MKNFKLLEYALQVVGVIALASCGPRDYAELKSDSKERVIEFLQAVKDGDKEKGNDTHGCVIIGAQKTAYEIAVENNPNWDPEQVSFKEEVDTITENRYGESCYYVLVYASHKGQKAVFKLVYFKDTRNGLTIVRFKNFIKFDFEKFKSTNGFAIERGEIWDDGDFLFWAEDAPRAAKVVRDYINSLKAGYKGFKFYPSSKNLIVRNDTLLYGAKIEKIVPTSSNIDYCYYRVICSNNIEFTVINSSGKWQIASSSGLYPFKEKLQELATQYNYDVDVDADRPSSDYKCAKTISETEEHIKHKLYINERVKYWIQTGLVVKDIHMMSGNDRDGETTKGVYLSFFNPTYKTIKYIVINARPLNAVGDFMGGVRVHRGIGPISPQESGTLSTDELFYDPNDVIRKLAYTIEVLYDDGSRKRIEPDKAMSTLGFNEQWWTEYLFK